MRKDDLSERQEMVNDFVTESRDLLDEIEPQIIAMEENAVESGKVDSEMLNTIFRLFHSIKGMASFLDLSTVITVTHEAETLLDLLRKGEVDLHKNHVNLLCRTSDFIRELMENIETQLNDNGFDDQAKEIIGEIKDTIEGVDIESVDHEEESEEDLQFLITEEMVQKFIDECLEILDETENALLQWEKEPQNDQLLDAIFRGFHSIKGNAGFFGYQGIEAVSHRAENMLNDIREKKRNVEKKVISVFLTVVDGLQDGIKKIKAQDEQELLGKDNLMALMECLRGKEENAHIKPNTEVKSIIDNEVNKKSNAVSQHAIRVDVEKLDAVLDLVGELVISVTMVAHNPDLDGLQLAGFKKSIRQLNKITRDIQDVAMSMRMIPLAGTFRKMSRLIRDLAVKENKKVTLEIYGEETEVDKTIIEQLSDPLVHLIRNAVDHGLETPAERLAAGKGENGKIILEAKHSAGEVWIIVRDNGKGLNREKILQKAEAKGLITEDVSNWKDEAVWQLIFEPGLSTSEEVSAISGRGVGMDVVKRNIENLHGRIDIRSQQGEGTLFVIRIPLTLAIIEGMVVKVGQALYTIPIVAIKKCLQPLSSQITLTPDGMEIVSIRGELLEVLRLHQWYDIKPKYQRLEEGILILVESDHQKCCLFVDELVGQRQIVIKSLPEYLGCVRGVSGMAVLGEGEVSMILDTANLIRGFKGEV